MIGHHARLMAKNDHQVQVIAGRGATFDERVTFTHLPLADSTHPRILTLKAEMDQGHVPPRFGEVVAVLKEELSAHLRETDVLIVHNVCSLHKNLALTAALWELMHTPHHPPMILWHHDLAWTTPRYRNELHPGYPWELLRTVWDKAIQVVISDSRRQELAHLLNIDESEILVIPNGVDVAHFLKLERATQEYLQRLNLAEADPLLWLPVRITPRKNIELALETLAYLRNTFPHAQLVVSGPPGPHNPANAQYFERLKMLRENLGLKHAAHFLAEITPEPVPDAVISDFYRLADALFLPSYEEGFGIPILEAALEGIPIFCSDIPPLRALGGDDVTYFSPHANPQEIANRIAAYLSSSPLYNLASRVRRNFTWERVYQNYLAPLLNRVGSR